MITCEIHEANEQLRELVVTVRDDGVIVLDRKNIGYPPGWPSSGQMNLQAEIRKMVSQHVEVRRKPV